MKIRTTLLLVPVALALWAAPAVAAQGRLDPSFGESGIVRVDAPPAKYGAKELAIGPQGRAYVLDGSLLIAFESDGEVASGFGEDGKVTLAPASGEGEPTGFAVDSQGRVLVVGTSHQPGGTSHAYVIRLLPDGSRDPSFGDGGEVDTRFGLTATNGQEVTKVYAAAIVVDGANRPLIGGSFATASLEERCGYGYESAPDPFVARLTAVGAPDTSFAGSGNVVPGGASEVFSLNENPLGGFIAFGSRCATPPRFEPAGPNFTTIGENGETNLGTTETPLSFGYGLTVDPSGRILELEVPPPIAEGGTVNLVRHQPGGELDPSFGRHGRIVVPHGNTAGPMAVDAEGRPLVATTGRRVIELRRFWPSGKLDRGFGPHGRLTARVPTTRAIAFDSSGRIYTLSVARNGAVEVARFIPGD